MYIDISKYNWPRYREQQLNTAIFKDFVSSFDEISTLPKSAREELKETSNSHLYIHYFR
jgi:adenine C2-methylase RlmN of 23S rRNA A2503 and tRNA A37